MQELHSCVITILLPSDKSQCTTVLMSSHIYNTTHSNFVCSNDTNADLPVRCAKVWPLSLGRKNVQQIMMHTNVLVQAITGH